MIAINLYAGEVNKFQEKGRMANHFGEDQSGSDFPQLTEKHNGMFTTF